jgi:uncharacterized membrane protein YhaH (DUF805 family)
VNFTEAIVSNFKRYVDFGGRSARAEYWWWVLFASAIGLVFVLLEVIVGGPTAAMYPLVSGLSALVDLALFLPGLGVAVRRLHDTNRSGWWVLLAFIAILIVPLIFLIVWLASPGTVGDNQYGPDPRSGAAGAAPGAQSTWAS